MLLLAVLSLPQVAQSQTSLPDCPGNLLSNAGFEQGFRAHAGVSRVIAQGWLPWPAGADAAVLSLAPQRSRSTDDPLVLQGLWSQSWRIQAPFMSAGIWQRVRLTAPARLQASAWARAWIGWDSDRSRSRPAGGYALSLGLDPAGGSDPEAEGIRWTPPITVTDAWLPLSLEQPVEAGRVSVFLRGWPLADASSEAHWDALCLRDLDAPLSEPEAEQPAVATQPAAPSPGPGTPSSTPDVLALATQVASSLQATQRAQDLALRATDYAATPYAGRSQSGPLAFGAPSSARLASGPAPRSLLDAGPMGPGWRDRMLDHMGLLALALAALAAGLVLGARRQPGDSP